MKDPLLPWGPIRELLFWVGVLVTFAILFGLIAGAAYCMGEATGWLWARVTS